MGPPAKSVMIRFVPSPTGADDRRLVGQDSLLNRTVLGDHESPYVDRFACDWHRLATTDPGTNLQDRSYAPPSSWRISDAGTSPDRPSEHARRSAYAAPSAVPCEEGVSQLVGAACTTRESHAAPLDGVDAQLWTEVGDDIGEGNRTRGPGGLELRLRSRRPADAAVLSVGRFSPALRHDAPSTGPATTLSEESTAGPRLEQPLFHAAAAARACTVDGPRSAKLSAAACNVAPVVVTSSITSNERPHATRAARRTGSNAGPLGPNRSARDLPVWAGPAARTSRPTAGMPSRRATALANSSA